MVFAIFSTRENSPPEMFRRGSIARLSAYLTTVAPRSAARTPPSVELAGISLPDLPDLDLARQFCVKGRFLFGERAYVHGMPERFRWPQREPSRLWHSQRDSNPCRHLERVVS